MIFSCKSWQAGLTVFSHGEPSCAKFAFEMLVVSAKASGLILYLFQRMAGRALAERTARQLYFSEDKKPISA